jgi:hypothetical protein
MAATNQQKDDAGNGQSKWQPVQDPQPRWRICTEKCLHLKEK